MDLGSLRSHLEEPSTNAASPSSSVSAVAAAAAAAAAGNSRGKAAATSSSSSGKLPSVGVFGGARSPDLQGLYKVKGLHRDLSQAAEQVQPEQQQVPRFGVPLNPEKEEDMAEVTVQYILQKCSYFSFNPTLPPTANKPVCLSQQKSFKEAPRLLLAWLPVKILPAAKQSFKKSFASNFLFHSARIILPAVKQCIQGPPDTHTVGQPSKDQHYQQKFAPPPLQCFASS